MKIDIIEKKKSNKYPWIGIGSDDSMVLFTEDRKGVSLRTGLYLESWDMDFFKPFTGTIILSND